MAIRIIYSIFLGLLVSLFIGLGIAAFYPAPEAPTYKPELEFVPAPAVDSTGKAISPTESPEQKKEREAYRQASDKYHKETMPAYNRRVSIISMLGAIIVLVISLTALTQIKLLSDGLLLGGVLTLLYSIIRSFMSDSNVYSFISVTIGLAFALILGYAKFIHPDKKK